MQSQKWQNYLSSFPRQTIQYQAYAPTSNAEEAEVEWFYQDLQDLLEQTPKKDVLFIIRDWNAKVGRNTWSNRQIWPWSTEWSRQRLIEFCQENTLVIANTLFQQHKRRLYTWTSPDGQHRNQTDNILCSQRWRSSIQSAKIRPGADYGSDHELLIAKFKLKFMFKYYQNHLQAILFPRNMEPFFSILNFFFDISIFRSWTQV